MSNPVSVGDDLVAELLNPDYAGEMQHLCSWSEIDRLLREAASQLAAVTAERDAAVALNNKYAWERDKAREERDVAERRSEAHWSPRLATAEAQLKAVREALEMIAGLRPCPDNLLGNPDIARAALNPKAPS